MSTPYIVIDDQMIALLDVIAAERSPVKRLAIIDKARQSWDKRISQMHYEAAYEARRQFAYADISQMTGIDRKRLFRLVSKYTDLHPEADFPRRKKPSEVTEFIDLTAL